MGFGAGHILDMIKTLKNNKRTRKSMFEKETSETMNTYGEFVDHKKMSEEELNRFKANFIKKQRKEQRKTLRIFLTVMILVIAVIAYMLFFY